MSLKLCVLGSGSSGNSTLIKLNSSHILIDAGFGPKAILKRLDHANTTLDHIKAILITHADTDHFKPSWCHTIIKNSIHLYCHHKHRASLFASIGRYSKTLTAQSLLDAQLLHFFDSNPFTLHLPDSTSIDIDTIHLPHDEQGSTGFLINALNRKLAFATDLGHTPQSLINAFANSDLIAIESNYDHHLELHSSRPFQLKQRVMGNRGHLSNDQSFKAVSDMFAQSDTPPKHVVLLHLSRQCNTPTIVRDLFATNAAIHQCLCITNQNNPTPWLTIPTPNT